MSVIATELAAFRLQQFHFFMNCQKVIQGSGNGDSQSLNKIWIAFTNQLQEGRDRSSSKFSSVSTRMERAPSQRRRSGASKSSWTSALLGLPSSRHSAIVSHGDIDEDNDNGSEVAHLNEQMKELLAGVGPETSSKAGPEESDSDSSAGWSDASEEIFVPSSLSEREIARLEAEEAANARASKGRRSRPHGEELRARLSAAMDR
mmetsp:Transcript_20108/g.35740  ORF Transcript_20108/g.35740 Transcript_20108/m.35740 type:complete len:204 (+) Transcript_20108:571-1182(+)